MPEELLESVPTEPTPEASSSTDLSKVTDSLKKITKLHGNKANEAANLTVPPAKVGVVRVPTPATLMLSKPGGGQFKAIQLGRYFLERATGIDFLLMQRAAAKDGIKLVINSAYRSTEAQQKIYDERMDPITGKLKPGMGNKGVAAKPGKSNHNYGIAIDIQVGMKPFWDVSAKPVDKTKDLNIPPGYKSPTYVWLQENIARFGFDREDAPSEPWHYRHKSTTVVGVADQTTLDELMADVSGAANGALDPSLPASQRLLALDVYDFSQAYMRSVGQVNNTRANAYALEAAARIAATANNAAYTAGVDASLQSSIVPPGGQAEGENPYTYDFEVGMWAVANPSIGGGGARNV